MGKELAVQAQGSELEWPEPTPGCGHARLRDTGVHSLVYAAGNKRSRLKQGGW